MSTLKIGTFSKISTPFLTLRKFAYYECEQFMPLNNYKMKIKLYDSLYLTFIWAEKFS